MYEQYGCFDIRRVSERRLVEVALQVLEKIVAYLVGRNSILYLSFRRKRSSWISIAVKRRLENIGVADDPVGHETAVGTTRDAQSLLIYEIIFIHDKLKDFHNIVEIAFAVVASYVGEICAVSRAPHWDCSKLPHIRSRESLELVHVAVTIGRLGTSVYFYYRRVSALFVEVNRLHYPAIDNDTVRRPGL